MKIEKLSIVLMMVLSSMCSTALAQEAKESVRVFFRQGYSKFEPMYSNNGERMGKFISKMDSLSKDTTCRMHSLYITGSASPEGLFETNRRLAEKRINQIVDYLKSHADLGQTDIQSHVQGIDWQELLQMVRDSEMPYRQEVIDILTAGGADDDSQTTDARNRELKKLAGGKAWQYMYEHFFPNLRSSNILLSYQIERPKPEPEPVQPTPPAVVEEKVDTTPQTIVATPDTVQADTAVARKPVKMALKTNLLYDLALVPNIAFEIHVGKRWTLGANWIHSWWNSDKRKWFHRIYGTEVGVRKYFGGKDANNPMQGHHIGIYGETFIFDFEMGGRGYLGGKPGGSLFERANYGASIEYGYSHPIARRLNLDFVLGVGYQGGDYWEYEPEDDHFVWRATKRRKYFGPTKAEVSLVWLLEAGRGKKKGGRR